MRTLLLGLALVIAPSSRAGAPALEPDAGVPLEHCVEHGGASTTQHTTVVLRAPDGGVLREHSERPARCSLDAECFEHPGQLGPTDGFVELECAGARCVCTVQSAEPGSAPRFSSFSTTAPCTRLSTLLRTRCGARFGPKTP